MHCIVIADDLTGANDTGNEFARRGYETAVLPRSDSVVSTGSKAAVTVVNTDSRYVDPDIARERVTSVIDSVRGDISTGTDDGPPAVVYKKVDSTLRGNLVAEVDAAMTAADVDVGVVAPAFPDTGRLTSGGYHLVDGTPVSETAAVRDPNGPATSHVPSLFEDSTSEIVHCAVDSIDDAERLRDRFDALANQTETVVAVCDATTTGHLSAIATAAATAEARPLYVGSAGLARHVRLEPPDPVLGVVGSVANATLSQLDAVPTGQVVTVNPAHAVRNPERAIDRSVDALIDVYADNDWAVVTSAMTPADVNTGLDAGREQGLDETETGEQIADTLGSVARAVHRETRIGGLFLSGGTVATATLDALGVERLRQTGTQVEAGIPVTMLDGGEADGVACVTKAGRFGSDTVIVDALQSLTEYHG